MALQRKTIISTKVLTLLQKALAPLSMAQIQKALAEMDLSPNKSTLYRMMDKLIESKLVTSITLSNAITYYEMSSKEHHHHFICNLCLEITCLKSCHVEKHQIDLDSLLPSPQYKISHHDFNIYGICERCTIKTG